MKRKAWQPGKHTSMGGGGGKKPNMQTKQMKSPIWKKVQETEENFPKELLIREELNKYIKSRYRSSNIKQQSQTEINEIFKCSRKEPGSKPQH